jgi:hypothetical protein
MKILGAMLDLQQVQKYPTTPSDIKEHQQEHTI